MNARIIAFPGCAVPEPEPERDEEQFALDVAEAAEILVQLTMLDNGAFDLEVANLRDRLTEWLGDG